MNLIDSIQDIRQPKDKKVKKDVKKDDLSQTSGTNMTPVIDKSLI